MKPNNFKSSISRKSQHTLSRRQRIRVLSEIRNRLRLQYRSKCNTAIKESENVRIIQDISDPSTAECALPRIMLIMIFAVIGTMWIYETMICLLFLLLPFLMKILHLESIELSFQDHLASCFVNNNLTHVQGNSLLSLFRTHPCFSNLSKDEHS